MNFDKYYSSRPIFFGVEQSDGLTKFLKDYNVSECTAIDIGAGEGRNSFYLANQGYKVIAIEPSIIGAKKIELETIKNKYDIKVINDDFLKASLPVSEVKLIVAITSLDHMEYEYLCNAIIKIKQLLSPSGYVYIVVFTQDDPGFKKESPKLQSECSDLVKHYFDKNELKGFFSDFEILYYSEYLKEDNTHGKHHLHGKAKLFARKRVGK